MCARGTVDSAAGGSPLARMPQRRRERKTERTTTSKQAASKAIARCQTIYNTRRGVRSRVNLARHKAAITQSKAQTLNSVSTRSFQSGIASALRNRTLYDVSSCGREGGGQ
jgi:hypothetical protein